MLTFFSVLHVLLCVFMIFVILLQPGKDAGMGAALGGGAATSAFGGRGAVTFLGKVTAFCAAGFFITSLGLSFVGMRSSVTAGYTPTAPEAAPAAPAPMEATPPAEAAPAPSTVTPGSTEPADIEQGAPAPGTEAVPAEKLPAQ